jgi:hypothetical protein
VDNLPFYALGFSIVTTLSCGEILPSTETQTASSATKPNDNQLSDESQNLPSPAQEPEHQDEAPVTQPLRFVVLGDGGEGNQTQHDLATVIEEVCENKGGCDFALYLGDNFYSDGINRLAGGLRDPQFQKKFEIPYANLGFPFYVVLGNHDYGQTSVLSYKAQYEVDYHDASEKWTMPARYYSVRHENVALFGLDTNAFMTGDLMPDVNSDEQWDWFAEAVSTSDANWKIAFGHHPYRSNGSHGNAGSYEGYDWLPFFSGHKVKAFMEAEICGAIDIYFAGHDHNRQWLEPTCGTEFVISGAAAKTNALAGRNNPSLFEDDSSPGFLLVEIQGNLLQGEFYNLSGTMDFSHSLRK